MSAIAGLLDFEGGLVAAADLDKEWQRSSSLWTRQAGGRGRG